MDREIKSDDVENILSLGIDNETAGLQKRVMLLNNILKQIV